VLQRIEARGAEVVAENVRQTLSQVFRYAAANGRADADPAAALKGMVVRPKIKHNMALSPRQLPGLLQSIAKYGGNRSTKIAIELMLRTFVRTVELRGARWGEFDFEGALWRVPAERMKMEVEHLVPLSTQAVELLHELKNITGASPWLFPNLRRPEVCMTATTINRALERMGFAGKDGIGFSAHGFRGTASTILHEKGYPSEIIERQLAHAERNKVKASYNKAQYMDQRSKMLQDWSDFIDTAMAKSN
jgi:integrase